MAIHFSLLHFSIFALRFHLRRPPCTAKQIHCIKNKWSFINAMRMTAQSVQVVVLITTLCIMLLHVMFGFKCNCEKESERVREWWMLVNLENQRTTWSLVSKVLHVFSQRSSTSELHKCLRGNNIFSPSQLSSTTLYDWVALSQYWPLSRSCESVLKWFLFTDSNKKIYGFRNKLVINSNRLDFFVCKLKISSCILSHLVQT